MSRNCAQRIGVRVSASRSDKKTATVSVIPNWKKNRPIAPRMNTTGKKIAAMAMVAAMAAKVISTEPSSAALRRDLPISACLTMFSSTMMASSTTMPIASESPSRVNVLRVNPMK